MVRSTRLLTWPIHSLFSFKARPSHREVVQEKLALRRSLNQQEGQLLPSKSALPVKMSWLILSDRCGGLMTAARMPLG